ncbi:phage/plasmid primase, P4 family [Streptococcus dysgalactiae]|uniref:Phage DNA polymerase n=2 Tax=Streptococcaceae TaxID=1300 RepID=S6ET02_LACLL|nr:MULTISPECIES: phage/plasmid primase, P4 family [Lactobacillales]HAB7747191.1 DNA primase [Listeria monocytogenes]MDT2554530.1 phage/plasmid primase, P4 family [Enterococcus raffinosus]MDT2558338.1 phage/plasmid primase, P4 family [Lactococcus petauri]MDT2585812.1 phage/plasmid primase, P4 family [Lactococcus petauri]QGH04686.1 DNA primase [Streptococcus dysgalactiae subsp. dysgalactiae]
MINFTLYTANTVGNEKNSLFPTKAVVTDKASLLQAVQFDHVTAEYKNNYRKGDNFIQSDVIPLDCDNDHSDNPSDWITSLDVAMQFPDVAFAVTYSRNHNKVKGEKAARPRFHVYFPITPVTDKDEYVRLKQQINEAFPYFDDNAMDAARLLFGTSNQEVEIYEGSKRITDVLSEDLFADWEDSLSEIGEGSRNSTMSHIAGKLIKRYGAKKETYELFLEQAEKCNPPLPDEELKTIWNSAVNFGKKVKQQEGYIPPEQYNKDTELEPTDYSDVGQATVLAREYECKLRYSPSTDYIVYNGSYWEESAPKSQAVAQALTERQLEEAEAAITKQTQEMVKNGAFAILASVGPKKAVTMFNKVQAHSYELFEAAQAYKKYAVKRRDDKFLSSALKVARPMLEIEQRILDVNEFLLNTPSATYDLRTGAIQDHKAEDYITKQTECDPSLDNEQLWLDALNTIFVGDQELIGYVQMIVGLAAIGKVYVEALIISYGEGRNGKSTFWNVISRVLGNYSGSISADILTSQIRRNVKPELAEAKGKRLLIAAELEEGMRLNTSNIKQLCSTDEIAAEKKYKDPFKYVPTHTLVLYTNHLPKVGAIDKGTWRRLIVIPFLATIEGNKDVKNYADYLFENAGGAVLKWILEGARKVIAADYKLPLPHVVDVAIKQYKSNNDWLGHFLEERCELDPTYTEKSGELYSEYRSFCMRTGEFARSIADFYTALESEGIGRKRTKKGVIVSGIRVVSEFID